MKKRLTKDEKDLLLISALRENSRQTLSKISKKTSMPLSTIHDRIMSLKRRSLVKYTALVDFTLLGFNTRACMLIKVDKKQRKELKQFLENSSNVNWLAKINNGHDFMVELVFENIKNMEDYVEKVEQKFEVQNMQTFYIVEDIKKEKFLATPMAAKLRIA
ncbi:Lrp/AsnC family transcriptional regulator [Candidatus Woesearchaeota archaeon]|nr:MAG: Lrp/AsnC family transcriptional regulator [Candidatus Woesearchaeota archaeon]